MTDELPSTHADSARRTSPWAIASLLCAISFACPLLALLGPLLGIKAIAHVRSTPGVRGIGLASAGIVIGVIGIVTWVALGYIWHVEVRMPLLDGPEPELRAGLSGDFAAFKAGFTEPAASLPDEQAIAFLREFSIRYGALHDIQQDDIRADPEPGRVSDIVPYVLTTDVGLVQAEAKLVLFADGIKPRWAYMVVLDDERGDLSYPQAADRLPEPPPIPDAVEKSEDNASDEM